MVVILNSVEMNKTEIKFVEVTSNLKSHIKFYSIHSYECMNIVYKLLFLDKKTMCTNSGIYKRILLRRLTFVKEHQRIVINPNE